MQLQSFLPLNRGEAHDEHGGILILEPCDSQ